MTCGAFRLAIWPLSVTAVWSLNFAGSFAPFNGQLFTILGVSGNNITTSLDAERVASTYFGGWFIYFGPPTTFIGTISGNTLTVASPSGAAIKVGASLFYAGLAYPANSGELSVVIRSFGTGTGGAGTYNLNISPGNVRRIAMTAALGSREVTNNLLLDARNSTTLQATTLQLCTDQASVTGGEYVSQYALSGLTSGPWAWGMWNGG